MINISPEIKEMHERGVAYVKATKSSKMLVMDWLVGFYKEVVFYDMCVDGVCMFDKNYIYFYNHTTSKIERLVTKSKVCKSPSGELNGGLTYDFGKPLSEYLDHDQRYIVRYLNNLLIAKQQWTNPK